MKINVKFHTDNRFQQYTFRKPSTDVDHAEMDSCETQEVRI